MSEQVENKLQYFKFLLDPGTATSCEIAELFSEMSELSLMITGTGLYFEVLNRKRESDE